MGRTNGRAHKSRSDCKDGKSLHFQQGSRRSHPQQMPVCKYGHACTRRDCIYRHPKSVPSETENRVCMAYLAGSCSFGSRCYHYHPPDDEAEKMVQKYSRIQCRYGTECLSDTCLYAHPETTNTTGLSAADGPDPRLARVRAFLLQKRVAAAAEKEDGVAMGPVEVPVDDLSGSVQGQPVESNVYPDMTLGTRSGNAGTMQLSAAAAEFVPRW